MNMKWMKERDPLTLLGKKWEQVSQAFSSFFETKGRQTSAKAHEAIDHMANSSIK
jgi:hypothetical protein